MTDITPYDYTKLDEIILFKGTENSDIIELTREGRYINLIKPKEQDKRYYRYDLKDKKFQRINFYKTTNDKITDVKVKNITGWFKDTRIITKDLHFGRLIIFARHNYEFNKYKSPVRFIEQLGHKIITSIEQWEALGFKVQEMEEFFGDTLVGQNYDLRKEIYQGETQIKSGYWHRNITYYQSINIAPSDLSKELLQYIQKKYTTVNSSILRRLHTEYNNGEYHIEQKLKKIGQDPEFTGIFHYKTNRRYYRDPKPETKWTFGPSHESRNIKGNLMNAIQEYNLDLTALCKWLKKQQHVDKNDIGYLLGDGNHYTDYLICEYDLCDGRLSKMNKYPDNFRSQFHRIQEEYNAKKADIDEAKFEKQAEKNKTLEHTGKKYQIIIPRKTQEIHNEAQCLQHCVRTYIPRVVEGQTLILFLRDKKTPEEPLVTLEVKKGALTQAYGKNDKKPKQEHLKFLKMWCKMKNLKVGCWKKDLK